MVAADYNYFSKTFLWRIRCLPPFGFSAHFLRYDPTAHSLSYCSGKLKLDTEGVQICESTFLVQGILSGLADIASVKNGFLRNPETWGISRKEIQNFYHCSIFWPQTAVDCGLLFMCSDCYPSYAGIGLPDHYASVQGMNHNIP